MAGLVYPTQGPTSATTEKYLALKEKMAKERATRAMQGAPPPTAGASTIPTQSSSEWLHTRRQGAATYTALPFTNGGSNIPNSMPYAPVQGHTGPTLSFNPVNRGLNPMERGASRGNDKIWFFNVPRRDWRGNLLTDPAAYWDVRIKLAAIVVPVAVLFIFLLTFVPSMLVASENKLVGPPPLIAPDGSHLWSNGDLANLSRITIPQEDENRIEKLYVDGWNKANAQRVDELQHPAKYGLRPPQVLFIGDDLFQLWRPKEETGHYTKPSCRVCWLCKHEVEAYDEGECSVPHNMFENIMKAEPFADVTFNIHAMPEMSTVAMIQKLQEEHGWDDHHMHPLVIVLNLGAYDISDDVKGQDLIRKGNVKKNGGNPHKIPRPVHEVAAAFRVVLNELLQRFPQTEILVMPVLPRSSVMWTNTQNQYLDESPYFQMGGFNHKYNLDSKDKLIPDLNTWYQIVAAGFKGDHKGERSQVHWQDCSYVFLDSDAGGRKYIDARKMPDMLFPSMMGHELLLQCLQPKVHELLYLAIRKQTKKHVADGH